MSTEKIKGVLSVIPDRLRNPLKPLLNYRNATLKEVLNPAPATKKVKGVQHPARPFFLVKKDTATRDGPSLIATL